MIRLDQGYSWFPSLKGFDFGLDKFRENWQDKPDKFPSLKGFDFGLDEVYTLADNQRIYLFPSLKGFDFGLDLRA